MIRVFNSRLKQSRMSLKPVGKLEHMKSNIHSRKTNVETSENVTGDKIVKSPLHKGKPHSLSQCRQFRSKSFTEKRTLLKKEGLCFKCYGSNHISKDCTENVICSECGKPHETAMRMTGRTA